jgi:myo-inositol catabolism protein IolS
MQYRQLGISELNVSVLAFGAWQIGDPDYWGHDDAADPQHAVDAAIDGGVNLFDTAEGYGTGESERMLGKLLGKRRDNVYIATKVFPRNCAPASLRAACEKSLQRLGTDYIDLYQIHWPIRDVPLEDVTGELNRLREEGKIRETGISNFGPKDITDWTRHSPCAANQLGYNLLFRAPEYEIIPECIRRNIGVLAYMPLMQGILAGRWENVQDIPPMRRRLRMFSGEREGTRHDGPGCEDLFMETLAQLKRFADAVGLSLPAIALCWLIAQPGISSVITGGRKPDQIRQNIEAADIDIGPAAIAQLNEITGPLKYHTGKNADMWESAENSRIQ